MLVDRARRRGAARGDHQRHRRQHLVRHRRGGDRRAVRTGQRAIMSQPLPLPQGRRLRLGRDHGRPRLAGADGRVRRGVRAVRRGDHDRRGARADGHGQAPAHRGADGAAADRRRLARAARARADATADIDAVYEVFVPMNVDGGGALRRRRSRALPRASRRCARAGLKIGSTTGYTREIMAAGPAGGGGAGLRARLPGLHRRHARRAADAVHAVSGASSSSASGRPGPASRSTTPRSASPRDSTAAAGPWAWR